MFQENEATTTRTKYAQNIQTQRIFTRHGEYFKTIRINFVNQGVFSPMFENLLDPGASHPV